MNTRLVPYCGLVLLLLAAASTAPAQGSIVSQFQFRSFTAGGLTLPYRLFVPGGLTPGATYPVVLALHGSGERGADNVIQLTANRLGVTWAEPASQAVYPAFVVVPQCPASLDWSITPMQDMLVALLDSLLREFPIDTDAQFITGLSMGGYGAWDLIGRFPHRFAAAIPMSSGMNPACADSLRSMPVWNFHGTRDDAVPVAESRLSMHLLEQQGRTVVYTNCRNADCTGLPDSVIRSQVAAHSDLLYTEYQYGGHVIWDSAYEYPGLHAWLFDHSRRTPGSVRLLRQHSYRPLSGIVSLQWNSANTGDSVEFWCSGDLGTMWQKLTTGGPTGESVLWDSRERADCPFAMLRVFIRNGRGHIYDTDTSSLFAVVNDTGTTPFVRIVNAPSISGETIVSDSIGLELLTGNTHPDPVTVAISYSSDAGSSWLSVETTVLEPDTLPQPVVINLRNLPNSAGAVIRVDATSGIRSGNHATNRFSKRSFRLAGPAADHVAGTAGGTVIVNIADPAALTGHRYSVTFDDRVPGMKSYFVTDLDMGNVILQGATQLDGTTESPWFDGIRLLVGDVKDPVVDRQNCGWVTAPSNILAVSPALTALKFVKGFPYPASYRLTFSDHVIDTAEAGFTVFTRTPINVSVTNTTEQRRARFAFYDNDGNGMVSSQDGIYIIEKDTSGTDRPTWGCIFAGNDTMVNPSAGDQYRLSIITPMTRYDRYEFTGIVAGVRAGQQPREAALSQNYPNPFNPVTGIQYSIPRSSSVTLRVYDVLGREVAVLEEGDRRPGSYAVSWNASALASGVYFYRLDVMPHDGTGSPSSIVRKALLLK